MIFNIVVLIFFKNPWPLFQLYLAFFKTTLQFLQQINVKNFLPVYGTGFRTNNLQIVSLTITNRPA